MKRVALLVLAAVLGGACGKSSDATSAGPLPHPLLWSVEKDGHTTYFFGTMHAGIDATTRFETNNWTKPLTQSVLEKDTPYNTRLNLGLPPGPIGSPGKASLEAAANPSSSNALYYVVKPGGKGAHAFSSTAEQFQRDVAAYNRARAANGGRDPSGG